MVNRALVCHMILTTVSWSWNFVEEETEMLSHHELLPLSWSVTQFKNLLLSSAAEFSFGSIADIYEVIKKEHVFYDVNFLEKGKLRIWSQLNWKNMEGSTGKSHLNKRLLHSLVPVVSQSQPSNASPVQGIRPGPTCHLSQSRTGLFWRGVCCMRRGSHPKSGFWSSDIALPVWSRSCLN